MIASADSSATTGATGSDQPDRAADTSAATKTGAGSHGFPSTSQLLPVPFSDAELAAITERAQAAGTNSAAFVRAATLGAILAGRGEGGRQP